MSEWRTIDSAPKDGTEVLGWIVYDGRLAYSPDPFQRASIMYWDAGCFNPGWEREPGWHKEWIGEPTHWQPLPPPPEQEPT
jgi:hypothetical protein